MTLAVDIGTLTVKVAIGDEVTAVPAPAGGPRAGIRAALATVAPSLRTGICVAVPDAWLTGNVAGASLQEDVRHECEDVAGTGPVTWTGQLAAVAALTAGRRGGRYLVCDVGGSGVRAGMFSITPPGTGEFPRCLRRPSSLRSWDNRRPRSSAGDGSVRCACRV
jgi:hypothetical protein